MGKKGGKLMSGYTLGSLTDDIIAYESGELDEEGTTELFQHLIDTGLAWTLQGSYGRAAHAMIANGQCSPAGQRCRGGNCG